MKFILLLLCLQVTIGTSFAKTKNAEKDDKKTPLGAIQNFTPDPDEALGRLLQQTLENIHFSHKRIDDDLSKKAFKLYLERIDYGKQFLTNDDVDKLSKYRDKFDDQLIKGDLSIIRLTQKIMRSRIPLIADYVKTTLKKDFDFKKNEKYETDAEKRKFVDDVDDLKERWHKLIKLEVLVQYFDLKDEQDGVNQKKDKKKKKKKKKVVKKEKKKTFKELMQSAREKVSKRYAKVFKRLQEEKKTDQQDKFYNSIARVYDPHTLYLVPEEKEDFDIDMSGKLEGIGALLREEGSFIKVERIIPGSASWRGKELKAEDIILGVGQGDDGDFVDVVDMSIRDAVKLIRGPKGSVVRLKVKKPEGTTNIIAITRDQVVLEESYVKSTIIEHKDLKQKIGYIHVPKFYRDFQNPNGRNSSEDVKKEIIKMKDKVDGIILNLRNNGGGALQDATLMGGLFIDKGPIVQVKNRGEAKVHRDVDGKIYWDKPLIVLVNRFSASASEIVAAALKDYDRAVIVGSSEQTHGKGTVQAILNLQDYLNPFFAKFVGPIGAMKITTDMFYRINGMSTQFRGVKPDILLPDQYGYLESGEKSLDYAIPYNEIKGLKYKKWNKQKYNLTALKQNSEERVKRNKKFQKIIDSVNWSKKRKDDSIRSLNLVEMEKFRKEAREVAEKDKIEDKNPKIVVQTMKKLKNDVEKESFKEFQEELQKDPVIEETLYIFSDMLKKNRVGSL